MQQLSKYEIIYRLHVDLFILVCTFRIFGYFNTDWHEKSTGFCTFHFLLTVLADSTKCWILISLKIFHSSKGIIEEVNTLLKYCGLKKGTFLLLFNSGIYFEYNIGLQYCKSTCNLYSLLIKQWLQISESTLEYCLTNTDIMRNDETAIRFFRRIFNCFIWRRKINSTFQTCVVYH